MANHVYAKWKEQLIQAGAGSALTGTVKALLVDTVGTSPDLAYTWLDTHSFYSDIPITAIANDTTGNVLGISIGSHTYTNGTFSGAPVTFTAVPGGAALDAIILYIATGSPDLNRLVLYLDTSQTGLPVTPNGGDITVTWAGPGIFTISDRRLKDDIEMVDEMWELPVYRYRYNNTERVRLGFMAQDVERVVPDAVIEIAGRKLVNYERVFERIAA